MYSTTISLSEAKAMYKDLEKIISKVMHLEVVVMDSNAKTYAGDTTIEMIETRHKQEETWYRRIGEYTGDLMVDIVVRPVNAIRITHLFAIFSDRPSLSINIVSDPENAWPPDKRLSQILDPDYVSDGNDD